MIRKLFIALIVLVVIGGAAYMVLGDNDTIAQVTKGAEPQAATSSANAATAAAAPASGAPANGEFWTKRCNPEGDKYCEIFQRLMIKENNQRLIEFAVGYPKDSKGMAQAAIVLPLGVVVTDGIALKIDDEAPAKASFRICVPDGCIVVMNLPDAFLESMKKGKKITVSFLDSSGKQVNVEMSLEGFGKKLEGVKA